MQKVTHASLRHAHTELLRDLQGLEELTRSLASQDWGKLAARLEAIAAHLAEHFRLEEEDGYFDEVRQEQPRLERTIARLAEEHRQMADSLNALIQDAQRATNVETLPARIQEWIHSVRDHEARENALAQEAFSRDTGGQD
ncbi:MAG: hemerythrin domain-containing protein [Gemmataceae bacterium]